jgi:excisionase family DNA binding protein
VETMLSVAAAAKLVGRGPSTIRKMAQDGLIRAKKNSAGHYLVERTSLLAYLADADPEPSADGRRSGATRAPAPLADGASIAPAGAELALWKARAESAEESLRLERQRSADERQRHDAIFAPNTNLQSQLMALATEFRVFMIGEASSKPSRFSSLWKGKA